MLAGMENANTTPRVARTSSSVLLSDAERKVIRKAAHRSETSLSDYMRRVSVAQAEADMAEPQLFGGAA